MRGYWQDTEEVTQHIQGAIAFHLEGIARGRNINTRTAGVNRPGRGLNAREQSDTIADTMKSSIPCQACLARHIGLLRIALP